jgi:hypothetical protein
MPDNEPARNRRSKGSLPIKQLIGLKSQVNPPFLLIV